MVYIPTVQNGIMNGLFVAGFILKYGIRPVLKAQPFYYIPVRHDMMRQTNDCSPIRVMQHKVKYFQPLGLRPSGWVDLELCPRVWYNPAPNLGL